MGVEIQLILASFTPRRVEAVGVEKISAEVTDPPRTEFDFMPLP